MANGSPNPKPSPSHCLPSLPAWAGGASFRTFQGFHCRSSQQYNDMAVLVFNPQGFKISVSAGWLYVHGQGGWGGWQ